MATDPASNIIGLTPAPGSTPPARRQYWQLPAFFVGIACVIGAIRYFPPQPESPADAFRKDVQTLKTLVEKRPADIAALESTLARVKMNLSDNPSDTNVVNYHMACGYVVLAEYGSGERSNDNWQKSLALFTQCDPQNLPDALTQSKFTFRSAKATAAMGQGNPALLLSALTAMPAGEDQGDRSRLLAETCLRLTPPDFKRAREEYTSYLTSPHRADPALAAKMKVKLAELCMKMSDFDKAKSWLKEVGTAAPAEVQAQAKGYLAQLALAENNPQEAVKLLESVQTMNGLPPDQLAIFRYRAGLGYSSLKDDKEATNHFQQAAAFGGDPGIAASVRLAEMGVRDQAGRGNRVKTAELLESVVRNITPGTEFRNQLIGLDDVRKTFEESIRVSMLEGDYATALRIANSYTAVAEANMDKARRAEIYETWAGSTKKTTENAAQLRDAWTKAAEEYLSLGKLQNTSAGKADYFRRACSCQQSAGDDAAALQTIGMLDTLTDLPPDMQAPIALKKGELLLTSKQFDPAVKAFQSAMAAGGPASTVAQVKLARAYVDEGRRLYTAEADKARKQIELGQNLYTQVANKTYENRVEKEAQEEALYDLGKLLMGQNLSEAEARFRQMIQIMPDGALNEKAKLFLGSCLLLEARGDQKGPPADAEKKLTEALATFETLTSSKTEFMQSQADIRVVNTLLLLKKYNELQERCGKLTDKYRGKPEELIVLSMQHSAWLRLDRNDQAARVFARMQDSYGRIPTEAYTDGMPEFSKSYWARWFEQMKR